MLFKTLLLLLVAACSAEDGRQDLDNLILSVFPSLNTTTEQTETSSSSIGASCDDKGVQGTCRKAKSCPSYALLSPQLTPEATLCSGEGDGAIVCCTDCHVDDVSNAAVTPDGVFWKTGGVRKAYDKCLEYAASLPYPCKDGKIVTPKKVYDEAKKCHRLEVTVEEIAETSPHRTDFPSLVLLGYKNHDDGQIGWICHGFIISERFIVTTGHCLRGNFHYEVILVAAAVDTLHGNGELPSSVQKYTVKQRVAHPDSQHLSTYNDIGLVEINEEFQFSRDVLPMCLSELTSDPQTVHTNLLGNGTIPNKKAQFEKITNEECSQFFPESRLLIQGINFTTQACFKGVKTKASCIGSNGRPISTSGDIKCMEYATGITTFGKKCLGEETVTVYTRVQPYLDWISSIVWP